MATLALFYQIKSDHSSTGQLRTDLVYVRGRVCGLKRPFSLPEHKNALNALEVQVKFRNVSSSFQVVTHSLELRVSELSDGQTLEYKSVGSVSHSQAAESQESVCVSSLHHSGKKTQCKVQYQKNSVVPLESFPVATRPWWSSSSSLFCRTTHWCCTACSWYRLDFLFG